MSTKANDPKQTAPETEPVVDDIKTEPVTPDAEEKADKKTAQKEGKEKEPKASKEPKESKEKKETKKEIEADLAAEKDKYLRLLAEYDNFRRRSARERENIYADVRCETLKKFLPVYDSLSRALAQTPADDPARKGIEGIMNLAAASGEDYCCAETYGDDPCAELRHAGLQGSSGTRRRGHVVLRGYGDCQR